MIYEKCKDILLREIELVMKAAAIQDQTRLAVLDHEWERFEECMIETNVIEIELTALELEREKLFDDFDIEHKIHGGSDAKSRFYSVVCRLKEDQRNELTAIYRSLKMETLKLKIANESYMAYLSEIRTTVSDFFQTAFPERAGKMYTQYGTHFSHDMRSMVLNQSF